MKNAKKILTSALFILTLVCTLGTLFACAEPEPQDPAYYQIDDLEIDSKDNKLIFVTAGGRRFNAGNLPKNPSNLKFVDASITKNGELKLNVSGHVRYYNLPTLNKDNQLKGAAIKADGHLVLTTTQGEFDVGLIFLPTMPDEPLEPNGASEYVDREVDEKDAVTVEIKIAGYGTVTILVDKSAAPTAAEKFLSLVKEKKYNGKTFDMLYPDELFCSESAESTSTPLTEAELENNGLENKKGAVGLVLDGDGNLTSKLYFCTSDLPDKYDGLGVVFGYVTCGMNIIDKVNELTSPYSYQGSEDYPDDPDKNVILDDERRAKIENISIASDNESTDEGEKGYYDKDGWTKPFDK